MHGWPVAHWAMYAQCVTWPEPDPVDIWFSIVHCPLMKRIVPTPVVWTPDEAVGVNESRTDPSGVTEPTI